MDFSVSGSDNWETTAAQESFIHNYFQEQKVPSKISTSNKTLKKKTKSQQNRNSNDLQKRKLPIEKNFPSTTEDSISSFPQNYSKKKLKRMNDVPESTESSNIPEESLINYDKIKLKSKKNKLESKKNDLESKKNELESKKNEREQNGAALLKCNSLKKSKTSKKEKTKKSLKNTLKVNSTRDTIQNSEDSFQESDDKELISKRKKKSRKKKGKQNTKKIPEMGEDQGLEQNFEDPFTDSEDEELVSDIKSSDVFKEIQAFMKQSPFQCELENSYEKSSDELSEDDLDDSIPEVVPKITNVKRNVKENAPSKKRIINAELSEEDLDDSVPEDVSKISNVKRNGNESVKEQITVVSSKNKKVAPTLKDKAQQKLQAAKFRYLNEKLYTETGGSAFQYFRENVEEFHDYHKGYSLQVAKWPMNPVTKIISDLQNLKKPLVIADMGCGDAKIARTLRKATVHSFDIVALNEYVTACDISKVPLANESVDVVVFCLSLMGINLKEYLVEAHRILKMGGMLKIAEVESRIDDVDVFIKGLKCLGFLLQEQDLKHKIFVFLDLKKERKKLKHAKVLQNLKLRPCLYKKR